MSVEERLEGLGLTLPPAIAAPGGARTTYRPARRTGNLIYLAGQGPPMGKEFPFRGKIGATLTVEDGYEAARLTGLTLLANLKREIGDLDRVIAWVRVSGFVNSAPGFTQQSAVMNGISDLLVLLYGEERGLHARTAAGVAELPFDAAVEIEALVEVAPDAPARPTTIPPIAPGPPPGEGTR